MAAARAFHLTLVTPEKKLLEGAEIEEIFVPGFLGELNILPGHAPLMTTLMPGVLRYRLKGESQLHKVAVSWGYCQVNPTGVNVLADTAERPTELDRQKIASSIRDAESRLSSSSLESAELLKVISNLEVDRVREELVSSAGTNSTETTH
jgi:F-type H+-transporting ATPase subunit epsilon